MSPKRKRGRLKSSSSWGDGSADGGADSVQSSDWSRASSKPETETGSNSDGSCDFPEMDYSDDEGDEEDGDKGSGDPQSKLIDF